MRYRLPIQSDLHPPPIPSESDELIDKYIAMNLISSELESLQASSDSIDLKVLRCMTHIESGRLFVFYDVPYGLFRFTRLVVINVDGIPIVLVTYHTDPGKYYLFTQLANYGVYQGTSALIKQICDEIDLLQNGFPLTVDQLSTILTRFTTYGVKFTEAKLLIDSSRIPYYQDITTNRREQGSNLPNQDTANLDYNSQIL